MAKDQTQAASVAVQHANCWGAVEFLGHLVLTKQTEWVMSCELYWFLFIKYFKTFHWYCLYYALWKTSSFQLYPSIFPYIQFYIFDLLTFSFFSCWALRTFILKHLAWFSPFLPPSKRRARDKDLVLERDSREETWVMQGRGRTSRDPCPGHWGFIPFWGLSRMLPIPVCLKNGGLQHLSAVSVCSRCGLS